MMKNKTGRVNKTIGNLKTIWEQLDNACSEIDNATTNIYSMVDTPKELIESAESVDYAFSEIVSLKQKIEMMIEEKEKG